MKSRNVLIGLGVAAALAAGVGLTALPRSDKGGPGYGPGMMGGYGPGYGHMRGWGGGPGAGSVELPRLRAKRRVGSGPAGRQGEGYGPGYHMRGWGGGYGPGMMQGATAPVMDPATGPAAPCKAIRTPTRL